MVILLFLRNRTIFSSRQQFNSVQLLSCVRLFVTPWTAAHQASLSITNSWSVFKLMSIESVMPSDHLTLLPSIFPSIRVFSMSQFFTSGGQSISPSNEYSGLISFRMDWFYLLAVQGTPTPQFKRINSSAFSLLYSQRSIVHLKG